MFVPVHAKHISNRRVFVKDPPAKFETILKRPEPCRTTKMAKLGRRAEGQKARSNSDIQADRLNQSIVRVPLPVRLL
jgi:hypothetical protein